MYFLKCNDITNYIEKRAITLPNVIGNVIDFNYFSITLKALHICELESSATLTSGYLFKRTHHNTFKKWTRRWFTLSGARLLYQKRWELGGAAAAPMESDLRLCKVREVHEGERRFVFEIVSPRSRHLLQADSQPECAMWVQAIGKAIGEALNNIGKG
jgi:hypothetical protein